MNTNSKQQAANVLAHLDDLRNEKGLSVAQLSELCGVHFSTLHRIFRGESMPRLDIVVSIACALDCTALTIRDIKHFVA